MRAECPNGKKTIPNKNCAFSSISPVNFNFTLAVHFSNFHRSFNALQANGSVAFLYGKNKYGSNNGRSVWCANACEGAFVIWIVWKLAGEFQNDLIMWLGGNRQFTWFSLPLLLFFGFKELLRGMMCIDRRQFSITIHDFLCFLFLCEDGRMQK